MIETPQQYTARITGLVGEQDPWAIRAATPGRLRALVERATPAALDWTPAPERWSARQVAAHLADAELVGAWRFRTVLVQDGVTLQAYDQEAWAATFDYAHTPIDEALAVFTAVRGATLRLLRDVPVALPQRAGLHAERGREPVAHIMRMYAGHDLNHLAQIADLLDAAREHGA
jgi:hypothetical protein